ncbi:hypothetical protein EV426DRAFT_579780 [Tirmania nivea]|nr:hypothetical protein EV426DRAFT_579780 [Tirmania nivea]
MSSIGAESQDGKGRIWKKEDVERLVAWMEDHQENLRGKQAAWHKDVKDQLFSEDEWISIKRIKEKAQNLKIAWTKARKIRDQSGEGVRAEDQVPTFNALLESKCPMFWRLDAIWGTRPNAGAIVLGNSLQVGSAGDITQLSADESKDPKIKDSELEDHYSNTPASAQVIESSDEELEWERTLPRNQAPTPLGSTIATGKKRHHHDKAGEIRRILGDRGAIEIKKEEVRVKAEKELQKERLAAEDRRWDRKLESEERIAKIQADAQARQFQSFLQMMSIAIGQKSTFGGSGPEGTARESTSPTSRGPS